MLFSGEAKILSLQEMITYGCVQCAIMLMAVASTPSATAAMKSTVKKKRQKIAASDLKRHKCHHEIHNLISFTDVFWCVKADNDGKEWKEEEERKLRPTGCVLCKGTFVLTSKKNV